MILFVVYLKNSYSFAHTQTMDNIKFYLFYLDSIFSGYPFIIRTTVILVMLLLTLYVIAMLKILIAERTRNMALKRQEKISETYKSKLISVLLTAKDMSFYEVKDILNPNDNDFKNWEKKYLTYLIVGIKNNPALNENNYKHVLEIFPVTSFWEKKILQNDVSENKNALRILDQIKEGVSGSFFTKKINSNDATLRKHIKSEYLKYASNDAFKFLENNFDIDFNALDAVRLHDSLKERNAIRPLPLLSKWLKNSDNQDFQTFIIREIGYFNQRETAPFLIQMFKTSNSDLVKSEISNTLGVLNYEEAVDELAEEYPYYNTVVQESIIDMMGNIKSKNSFEFLKKIYPETQNGETMIKVIKNMYKIDKQKTNAFVKKSTNSDFDKETLAYIQNL